jgi:two-component system response regulator FixJ
MQQRAASVVSIVDDDASIRRSVRNLLLSLGFQVETFASAEDFLGSAQQGQTGCLVLDLRMPGMSGLELVAHLVDTKQHIPIVILTSHGDEEAREGALRAGVVAFLRKPFRSDELVSAVKRAMGG